MELDNDKCDVSEYTESIAAETDDAVPQLDEATPATSPAGKVPDDTAKPVILWRSLMLQQ